MEREAVNLRSKTCSQEENRRVRVSSWEFEPLQERCSAETESPETELDREELRAAEALPCRDASLTGALVHF